MQDSSFHEAEVSSLIRRLGASLENGLSASQIVELRKLHGFNELARRPPPPLWRELFRHFNELVIWILVAASVITAFLGDAMDTVVILGVALFNGLLGFFQERRAGQAFAALEKLSAPKAKVVRDGAPLSLPARELLPGDTIELEEGDFIPADARLLEASRVHTQESALTGESLPVAKNADAKLRPDTPLADRTNMVFLGTAMTSGRARALVVATGMQTELGHIAGMLQASEIEATPLQKRIQRLGRSLVAVCLAIIAVTFCLQMLRGGKILEVFLLSVSLAVAAVPEGLPAIVTIALAIGMRRMAKKQALIRRLPSVETLGSVSVICSDKTGTLTRNEMTVRTVHAGGRFFALEGSGYEPKGACFALRDGEKSPVDPSDEPDLLELLRIGARCNHARLVPPDENKKTTWQIFGDPTDGALRVAALKAGVGAEETGQEMLSEAPFDSQRKSMSVVLRSPDGHVTLYTKGATESVLPKCSRMRRRGALEPLDEASRAALLETNRELASQGLRVIALAFRDLESPEPAEGAESNLVFSGFAAMMDPPREEARAAVAKCRTAGIRPVMITGDHPSTALTIARELGIATEADRAMTGTELASLSPEALADTLGTTAVFARVAPEHKLYIVRAWKKKGSVVAMTGDGVNDAPAIQEADIGIAMGMSGTDVTKEASDLVLLDDNFATIVSAVEEGRGILDNIKKVLHYLLAGNTGEILVMFTAALAGLPYPLLATQILWINLVTDGLPALALGREPVEADVMRRKPLPLEAPILTRGRGVQILAQGALVAGCVLSAFLTVYRFDPARLAEARSTAFCTLACAHVLFAFCCRSEERTILSLGVSSNRWLLYGVVLSLLLQAGVMVLPPVRSWFDVTVPLSFESSCATFVFSLIPLVVIEASKGFRAWRVRCNRAS